MHKPDLACAQAKQFTYDELGRILTSTDGTNALAFKTDSFGNRWQQNVTAGTAPNPSFTLDTTTNKITSSGFVYDALGNMTNDGIHTYTYDAENRSA